MTSDIAESYKALLAKAETELKHLERLEKTGNNVSAKLTATRAAIRIYKGQLLTIQNKPQK